MEIEFESVTGEDGQIRALYDLLSRRIHGISHQQMPDYDQHRDFISSNPYLSWHLVKTREGYIGSVYVTDQNTIGINILDDFIDGALASVLREIRSRFVPLPAIKSVRSGFFSVNVAPGNARLRDALERHGCVLAQLSYLIG